MKAQNFLKTVAVALSGVALAGLSAKASTITAQSGDLLLGFYSINTSTGSPSQTDVLTIDLGQASQFYNATPGSTFTLSGVTLADLSGIYGSSWFTSTSNLLSWGVVGVAGSATSDGHAKAGTVWSTVASGTGSRAATTKTSLNTAISYIQTLQNHISGVTSTANSSTAFDDSTGSSGNYYSEDTVQSGVSFGNLSPLVDNTNTNVVSGVEYSDLWEQQPGTNPTAKGTASLLGTFALSNSGVLTFTAAPEPSTVTLAIAAGLAMLASRRRRLA